MAVQLSPPSSKASGRPLAFGADKQGHIFFHSAHSATTLQGYLLINETQLDAIIADVDQILQLPANAELIKANTIVVKSISTDVRQIALDIEQRHAKNCAFMSHPDVKLLQCSLREIVKMRIAVAKHAAETNNSVQMLTSSLPVHKGVGAAAPCVGQKHPLEELEDTSPMPAKKKRIFVPKSTPAPFPPAPFPPGDFTSTDSAPALCNCTIRIIGSQIAVEYHAALTRYLFPTISPYSALTIADLDYDKWILDLQRVLGFNPSHELLQYTTPHGGLVFIHNPLQWRCAITEMTLIGKTILDFEIVVRHVADVEQVNSGNVSAFTPVNAAIPKYFYVEPRSNEFDLVYNDTTGYTLLPNNNK